MFENVFPLLGQVGAVTVVFGILAVVASAGVAEILRVTRRSQPRPSRRARALLGAG